MAAFLAWWLASLAFGLAALPLARRFFAWLPDRGYAFARTCGLLLVAYLLWLGASSGLIANTAGGITLALLVTAGLSAWAALAGAKQPLLARLKGFWREQNAQILVVEGLFLLSFAGWALVRAYAPEKIMPASGEKFMEIAFLNGVLNSPHFPPLDPWMAGYPISYYYFGYVMMGVMTRSTGVSPTVGFDLYDALLFALSMVTAYGVVSNLVRLAGGKARAGAAFGVLGGVFVALMGNLEGLLEGLHAAGALPAAFWQWLNIPGLAEAPVTGAFFPTESWWWWRASRVLVDLDLFGRPVPYPPIDEFPAFSFLLGDNHPHKLALPFVLLAVGLALAWMAKTASPPGAGEGAGAVSKEGRSMGVPDKNDSGSRCAPTLGGDQGGKRFWGQRSEWIQWCVARLRADGALFLFSAVLLGGLAFLNTWDFPLAWALLVLAYAAGRFLRSAASPPGVLRDTLLLGAGMGGAAVLLYLFFFLGFSSQAGGVLPYIFTPTRLPQYLVMFGPFSVILAFFTLQAAATGANRFAVLPLLRTWLRVMALAMGGYALALLLAVSMLSVTALKDAPLVQQWLGGLSPWQAAERILALRIREPWLFLSLSALLAVILNTSLTLLRQKPAETSPVEIQPARLALVFALLLAFAGLGLTFVPEFFYLRDLFGMRMNTIFKFYFQGWLLMACSSAFGAWWVLARTRPAPLRAGFALITGLLVAAGLVYPLMAIPSRAGEFAAAPNLDAAATFAGVYPGEWAAQPDDWAAILWLRANGRGPGGSIPTILEAGAGGYENAGRVSAFTGFPTLLGWTNHEGQWRGSQQLINERAPVIAEIYTSNDAQRALDLLRRWGVRYVIVGDTERQYASRLCKETSPPCDAEQAIAKFARVLVPVFQRGGTTVYSVP